VNRVANKQKVLLAAIALIISLVAFVVGSFFREVKRVYVYEG